MLNTKEHYDLMAEFEKAYKGYRLDREQKELWPKGYIYADGVINRLFCAFRQGYVLGKAVGEGR